MTQRNVPIVGVIGASHPTATGLYQAEAVGRLLGEAGAVLLCGGLGGVMEAASRGCCRAGGQVLGILPGPDATQANPYVTLPIPTNMGHARNVIIAHTAQVLIAIEGEYGTLSEMAVALKLGKQVFALPGAPPLAGVVPAATAEDAVRLALTSLRPEGGGTCPST